MIKIRNLNKYYGEQIIFEDFNIDIPENHITTILGESGSGKTTLVKMIAGIEIPNGGTIEGLGSGEISYIFQEPRLIPWMSVYDNIAIVLKSIVDPIMSDSIIRHHLDSVGLTSALNKYPSELSGGMIQRVAIARAFAFPSDVLIMDEPFKGLDRNLKTNLIATFLKMWKTHPKTVIFVTHDLEEAVVISDSLHVIKGSPAVVSYSKEMDSSEPIESQIKALERHI
jgi:NitT/TauT family transport system ATP-binding protein